jgi:hypothetical protein
MMEARLMIISEINKNIDNPSLITKVLIKTAEDFSFKLLTSKKTGKLKDSQEATMKCLTLNNNSFLRK